MNPMFTKLAIFALRPDAQWYFADDESIVWLDESQTEPTTSEIDAHIASTQYQRDRQAEYPDMGTQLNKIYDDGITKWKSEMVDPIKAKYPKP